MASKRGVYRRVLCAFSTMLVAILISLPALAEELTDEELMEQSSAQLREAKVEAEEEAKTVFNVRGDMDVSFTGVGGSSFDTKNSNDVFSVPQRLRVVASAVVSDEFSLHTLIRIKPDRWGDDSTANSGYNMDGDQTVLLTRFIFANWKPFEDTTVHMGIIPLELPYAAYRNGILETSFGGVSINYKFAQGKNVILSWGRAYDNAERTTGVTHDDTDLFVLMVPMQFEQPKVFFAPWAIYANIGSDSKYWRDRVSSVSFGPQTGTRPNLSLANTSMDKNGTGIWAGFGARFENGPFALKGDFAYGQIKTNEGPLLDNNHYNTQGWFGVLRAEYQTSFGLPAIFGWYGSGSDADDVNDKSKWGYLPTISTFGEGFSPTSLGFKGGTGVNSDGIVSWTAAGKWGVGAEISEISFVDKLDHTIRVTYYEGTNDKELANADIRTAKRNLSSASRDFVLMVKGDRFIEVNFDHHYNWSKHVDINLALGYINIHRVKEWGKQKNLDDVFAASLGFTFKF